MVQKRKAVAMSAEQMFQISKVDETSSDQHEEAGNQGKSLKAREVETTVARRKELKAMSAQELQDMLSGFKGSKSETIEKILKAEAVERKAAREREVATRTVVTKQKEHLEACSVPDLVKQCQDIGVKTTLSKEARVEYLLKHWLENDGINRTLAQNERKEREQQLTNMDSAGLVKICCNLGIDPFVTEVMLDRILKRDIESGRFVRPVLDEIVIGGAQAPEAKSEDVVATMLANEAARKQQAEQQQKEIEEVSAIVKEIKSKSKEELEKLLKKRGVEATGKKDELVVKLCEDMVAEKKETARKAQLKSLGKNGLKDLCSSKKLAASPKVDDMINALLDREKQSREQVQAYDQEYAQLAEEMSAKARENLGKKNNAELKDMLVAKGLKVGAGKEERVERLLEEIKLNNREEVDKAMLARAKELRRGELRALDKKSLKSLCEEVGADPFIKEVAVERILDAEEDFLPSAKRVKKC